MSFQDQADVEEDFDALSKSSYDFGHFHELDTDIDEPELEQDSLDPFTAALREQAASQSFDDIPESEHDDQYSFTQRLLTNAKTLKQLKESGDPEIKIEYDIRSDEDSEPPPASPTVAAVSRSSQYHQSLQPVQTQPVSNLNEKHTRSALSGTEVPERVDYAFTKESYDQFDLLSDAHVIVGMHEAFPVNLLREYSFDECQRILARIRRYSNLPRCESIKTVCLQLLWEGSAIDHSPIFKVVGSKDDKVLLADHHKSPCTVIGLFISQRSQLSNETDAVRLLAFHFDHGITEMTKMKPTRRVTIEDAPEGVEDDLFLTSSEEVSAGRGQRGHSIRNAATPVPLLVISKYESLVLKDWQEEIKVRSAANLAAQTLYDADGQNDVTRSQPTAETSYSDQFDSYLDIEDFPLEPPTPR